LWRALADGVLVVHLGFILFVVLGGALSLRWPRVAWLHVPAAVWGAWIEFSGAICPLTPLENRFRRAGGEGGYAGGFIDHYLVPILYPPGLTRTHQIALGCGVLILNVMAYAIVLRRRRLQGTVARQPAEP
jgi:hypothetical protein